MWPHRKTSSFILPRPQETPGLSQQPEANTDSWNKYSRVLPGPALVEEDIHNPHET